ncbi:hypothetical protein PCK1_002320 [Pneumocystis canis]|nr:hypothetical protein PCK1_002320 [Pneumocystis canis]
MSLASYLAEKYLNKETIKKKRNKKNDETIHIVDTDLTGWTEVKSDRKKIQKISEAEKARETLKNAQKDLQIAFKKGDRSSWQKVENGDDIEQELLNPQDTPVVVMLEGQEENILSENKEFEGPLMSSGMQAGLRTAKQVTNDLKRQKDRERAIFQTADPQLTGKNSETIYRDASGRRVDMELIMMEKKRQKAKEEAMKKLEFEMSQGEVQKREKLEKKRDMEAIKHMPFSRSIDDPELNRMLKEKQRWNDPAAAFLTKKSTTTKPVYKGYYSANRFGIAPGYRWDGVDRGNGFEKAWFAYQSEKKVREAQAYAWSTEDITLRPNLNKKFTGEPMKIYFSWIDQPHIYDSLSKLSIACTISFVNTLLHLLQFSFSKGNSGFFMNSLSFDSEFTYNPDRLVSTFYTTKAPHLHMNQHSSSLIYTPVSSPSFNILPGSAQFYMEHPAYNIHGNTLTLSSECSSELLHPENLSFHLSESIHSLLGDELRDLSGQNKIWDEQIISTDIVPVPNSSFDDKPAALSSTRNAYQTSFDISDYILHSSYETNEKSPQSFQLTTSPGSTTVSEFAPITPPSSAEELNYFDYMLPHVQPMSILNQRWLTDTECSNNNNNNNNNNRIGETHVDPSRLYVSQISQSNSSMDKHVDERDLESSKIGNNEMKCRKRGGKISEKVFSNITGIRNNKENLHEYQEKSDILTRKNQKVKKSSFKRHNEARYMENPEDCSKPKRGRVPKEQRQKLLEMSTSTISGTNFLVGLGILLHDSRYGRKMDAFFHDKLISGDKEIENNINLPPQGIFLTKTKISRRKYNQNYSLRGEDSAEKFFTCEIIGCQKKFRRSEHLKRHIRSLHTGEKPFGYGRKFYSTERSPSSKKGLYGGFILGATLLGCGYYYYKNGAESFKLLISGKTIQKDYHKVYREIAELMNSDEIEDYDDGSLGPILVRLGWHSSGTYNKENNKGGSNGATMRFEPESKHAANAGLHVARDALEKIKERNSWISYSDLWTLASVCAIQEMSGPTIPWRPGRVDGNQTQCPPDGLLPDASKEQRHLRDIFYRMGFNDQEIVALSGAHALGQCHTDRSGYTGHWTFSPTVFTNDYYKLLLSEKWDQKKWDGPKQYEDKTKSLMMLPTDISLIKDNEFRKYVELYAKDEKKFFEDFSKAFCKLLELGVPHFDQDYIIFKPLFIRMIFLYNLKIIYYFKIAKT